MSYHGIQLAGISIVLASLALGSGNFYLPNAFVAGVGVIVTVVGVVVDPAIELRLRKTAE